MCTPVNSNSAVAAVGPAAQFSAETEKVDDLARNSFLALSAALRNMRPKPAGFRDLREALRLHLNGHSATVSREEFQKIDSELRPLLFQQLDSRNVSETIKIQIREWFSDDSSLEVTDEISVAEDSSLEEYIPEVEETTEGIALKFLESVGQFMGTKDREDFLQATSTRSTPQKGPTPLGGSDELLIPSEFDVQALANTLYEHRELGMKSPLYAAVQEHITNLFNSSKDKSVFLGGFLDHLHHLETVVQNYVIESILPRYVLQMKEVHEIIDFSDEAIFTTIPAEYKLLKIMKRKLQELTLEEQVEILDRVEKTNQLIEIIQDIFSEKLKQKDEKIPGKYACDLLDQLEAELTPTKTDIIKNILSACIEFLDDEALCFACQNPFFSLERIKGLELRPKLFERFRNFTKNPQLFSLHTSMHCAAKPFLDAAAYQTFCKILQEKIRDNQVAALTSVFSRIGASIAK